MQKKKKTQIEQLKRKTTMIDVKVTLDGINNRSETKEEKISEFKTAIETI